MDTENLEIAKHLLKESLRNPLTEIWINHYIQFMDSLENTERESILLHEDITLLINKINGYMEG